MNGAIYVSDSLNTKISGKNKVDATYVSIEASCPKDCPLMDEGCYAQNSFVGIVSKRLNSEAVAISALQAARAEAHAIDQSYNAGKVPLGRDLRLHVSGDSRTLAGTKLINNAVGRWKARGGGDVWSYTHAWYSVPRKEWSNVSILGSITSLKEVPFARKQGYAPAIVVSEFPSIRSFKLDGSDVEWIPCPAQTKDVSCVDCRLCFDANRLFNSNYGIAFMVHGIKESLLKKRLKVLQ